jgi:phenylalanyl-tRNA synthetase beta chain
LEAAVFNPIIIRRARQRLGLQTESSYRFERGINPDIVEKSSAQATRLIQELGQGAIILAKASGIAKVKKVIVNLDIPRVSKILGINVTASKIKHGILLE